MLGSLAIAELLWAHSTIWPSPCLDIRDHTPTGPAQSRRPSHSLPCCAHAVSQQKSISGSGWYRLRRVPPLCQPILLPRILQPIRLAASLTRYKSTLFCKWVVENVFGWVAATCSDLQLQSARINYIVYAEGSNRSVNGPCAECQHKPPTVSWIILCLWRRVLLPGLGRDTRKSIPDYRYRNTNAGRLMYRYWDTFVCCNRIF